MTEVSGEYNHERSTEQNILRRVIGNNLKNC